MDFCLVCEDWGPLSHNEIQIPMTGANFSEKSRGISLIAQSCPESTHTVLPPASLWKRMLQTCPQQPQIQPALQQFVMKTVNVLEVEVTIYTVH